MAELNIHTVNGKTEFGDCQQFTNLIWRNMHRPPTIININETTDMGVFYVRTENISTSRMF